MLNTPSPERLPGVAVTSLLLIAAIAAGAVLGHFLPDTGQWLGERVDHTLLALVGLLFFGVRFGALLQAAGHLRFLAIALVANFVLVPMIGYGVASLFLAAHPLFIVGLVIYFMSPCTDWFLGFTRLAGGNVALGTALIPINMVVQLLLYPLYLQWFTQQTVQVEAGTLGETLLHWFLVPLVVAAMLHQAGRLLLGPARFGRVLHWADQATPWVMSVLVLEIFAANVPVLLEHRAVFAWVLLAVFVFFICTFLLGEGISRLFRLGYPEDALLNMTIAARNAPLMLAVTMAALPNQPLVYAALVIGMLVEFPHLTALRRLLLVTRHRFPPSGFRHLCHPSAKRGTS
ncbi:sodium Bile acid symporter family protein [Burkholderia pseudomallei MSHR4032]|uniref:arsenic resistance protein n=1 Tax=Burkholderia pseudomallei TaxID=28450 RepID=UPI00016B02F9|nr:arsenic resistance protein [Burkholderia pseudomallei]AGZ32644.1 sodium Bile acid symporter family protein [Burkholderia pseudomallei NCTC 13179]KGU90852.1 sodium Bile acid symporter family protein [Burkholderia pseudomallei MSHR4032]